MHTYCGVLPRQLPPEPFSWLSTPSYPLEVSQIYASLQSPLSIDCSSHQNAHSFHSFVGTSTMVHAHEHNHADSVMYAPSAGTMPIPNKHVPAAAPIELYSPSTPLRPLELEQELASHPDKGFVCQLIQNLIDRCRIGYHGPQFTHIAPHLPSAFTHSNVVDNALAKECQAGRMAGPYTRPPYPNLHCSGLVVVPKKDGGRRLIYH